MLDDVISLVSYVLDNHEWCDMSNVHRCICGEDHRTYCDKAGKKVCTGCRNEQRAHEIVASLKDFAEHLRTIDVDEIDRRFSRISSVEYMHEDTSKVIRDLLSELHELKAALL